MRSLTLKLTLAFLVVCLIEAVLVGVFARQATVRAFDRFLREEAQEDLVTDAATYYRASGSWEGALAAFARRGGRQTQGPLPGRARAPEPPQQGPQRQGPPPDRGQARQAPAGQEQGPPRRGEVPPPFVLVDQQGRVVLPGGRYRVGGQVRDEVLAEGTPVVVEGVVVGRVFLTDEVQQLAPGEQRYLARTDQALLYAALGALTISLFLGLFFARTYTRPLRQLTVATRALSRGDLRQEVPVQTQDELGTLTRAFNQMSADLAHANALRRQMTADIAHDLHTPLTVLYGYLEALRDGALPPTQERFEMLFAEVQRLIGLVEDLRTLSLADAGELTLQRRPVAPVTLLERTATSFARQAQDKAVILSVKPTASLPELSVDPDRMMCVLGNLVSNALRYTPAGGEITLRAQRCERQVCVQVQDTGAGIPAEALPNIFKRFYRADASRTQQEGASGLGLAIARSIVEAHGGTIEVESELGRGTTFTITLPGD